MTSGSPNNRPTGRLRRFEEAADEISCVQSGCLFVSFIYERGPDLGGEDDVIVESIEEWRERILSKLEQAAQVRPRLCDVDPASLADQVFTTFEGGFILARATNDLGHLRRQLSHLRHYMELLLET